MKNWLKLLILWLLVMNSYCELCFKQLNIAAVLINAFRKKSFCLADVESRVTLQLEEAGNVIFDFVRGYLLSILENFRRLKDQNYHRWRSVWVGPTGVRENVAEVGQVSNANPWAGGKY